MAASSTGYGRSGRRRVAGAVIAGGASRRWGRDKAMIEVGGIPMIDRVIAAVAGVAIEPTFIVGGPADRTAGRDINWLADRFPGEGPLGGIITALGALWDMDDAVDGIIAVACDLPMLSSAALYPLVDAWESADASVDVVVARTDRREPMCAIWSTTIFPALFERFQSGVRSLHRALDDLAVVEVQIDSVALQNVNAPGDLDGLVDIVKVGLYPVTIPEITVDELAALGPNVRLIDVRESVEWNEARVIHAMHVPLGTVSEHLDAFDGAPTYVICRSGGRSLRACEFVAAHGRDAVNVTGGMVAWIDGGHDVARGSADGAGA